MELLGEHVSKTDDALLSNSVVVMLFPNTMALHNFPEYRNRRW